MKAPVVSTFRTLDSMNEHAGRLSLFLPVESFHCYFIVISLLFHCHSVIALGNFCLKSTRCSFKLRELHAVPKGC